MACSNLEKLKKSATAAQSKVSDRVKTSSDEQHAMELLRSNFPLEKDSKEK
jgi:hypothetical protein